MGEEPRADIQDAAGDDTGEEAERGLEGGEMLDFLKEEGGEVFHYIDDGPGEEHHEADRGEGFIAPDGVGD